jgi:hypothetical protein
LDASALRAPALGAARAPGPGVVRARPISVMEAT